MPDKIKIIIYDGIVDCILASGTVAKNPPEIEIVDVDADYEDYKDLDDYATKLREDNSFTGIPFSVDDFKTTEEADGL